MEAQRQWYWRLINCQQESKVPSSLQELKSHIGVRPLVSASFEFIKLTSFMPWPVRDDDGITTFCSALQQPNNVAFPRSPLNARNYVNAIFAMLINY